MGNGLLCVFDGNPHPSPHSCRAAAAELLRGGPRPRALAASEDERSGSHGASRHRVPADEMPPTAYVAAGQHERDGQRPAHDQPGDDKELQNVLEKAHTKIVRGKSPNSGR